MSRRLVARPSLRLARRVARTAAVTAAMLAALAAALAAASAPAFAQPQAPVPDLQTVVNNITYWIMGLVAALATLFLVIGGARYLMAGGDPSEVERAKGALKSAAIG